MRVPSPSCPADGPFVRIVARTVAGLGRWSGRVLGCTVPLSASTAALLIASTAASALQLQVDYSRDAATDNFFATHATARAAVEQAARDVSSLVVSRLDPVVSASGVVSGSVGSTRVELDFSWSFRNPSTGSDERLSGLDLPADTVRLFVGVQELNRSTSPGGADQVLGLGGSGAMGVALQATGFPEELNAALAEAERQADQLNLRGGGPTISTLRLKEPFGPGAGSLELPFDLTIGSLALDVDTNNDGRRDSEAELNEFWHFDATTPVPPRKTDFYTVVAHEILHALGAGQSETWRGLIDQTRWKGPAVIREQGGSGDGLITADGSHLAEGLQSLTRDGGVQQEPLLSPLILAGERKRITRLDAALLEDLGWLIAPATPQGDFNANGLLDIEDLNRLLQATVEGFSPQFDLNGDGRLNQADRSRWVVDLRRTWFGDANLDGLFGTGDLLLVFQAGKFETAAMALWQEGDWDGDLRFSTGDLVTAFQDAGFERGPRAARPAAAAVPEPTGGLGWLLGAWLASARLASARLASARRSRS